MKNILSAVLVLAVAAAVLLFGGLNHKAQAACPVGAVKSVKAAHILVKTKEEADTLKTMIDDGEDFGVLARQYSECPSKASGGDLGYFQRGQMVKEFEDAAFTLPVGTVSAPVKTQFGWHLIKVLDKKY